MAANHKTIPLRLWDKNFNTNSCRKYIGRVGLKTDECSTSTTIFLDDGSSDDALSISDEMINGNHINIFERCICKDCDPDTTIGRLYDEKCYFIPLLFKANDRDEDVKYMNKYPKVVYSSDAFMAKKLIQSFVKELQANHRSVIVRLWDVNFSKYSCKRYGAISGFSTDHCGNSTTIFVDDSFANDTANNETTNSSLTINEPPNENETSTTTTNNNQIEQRTTPLPVPTFTQAAIITVTTSTENVPRKEGDKANKTSAVYYWVGVFGVIGLVVIIFIVLITRLVAKFRSRSSRSRPHESEILMADF